MDSKENSKNEEEFLYKATEKFIFPKKISTTYSYNDSIKRVWDVFKDFDKCNADFADMRTKCEFIVGNNTFEVNNEFKMTWKDSSELIFKCINVVDEEFHKKIAWRVHVPDYEVYYTHIYIIHSNTIEKNSILIWDIIYDQPEKLPFTKDTLINMHKILLESCKRYEIILKKNLDNLNQTESVIINKEKEKIWRLITNWKEFVQIVPAVADEVELEGDPQQINSVVRLKFTTRDVECKLKVISINNNPQDEKWEYNLECVDGKPRVPKQILSFNLMDISDNMTFISFKHEFKQMVKYELMQSISNEKKKILSGLKNYFEFTNKEN